MRFFLVLPLLSLPTLAWSGQLLNGQVFDRYSPLVEADEFSRRVFTPTTADRLERFQKHLGQRAVTHTVDLHHELFDVWLPSRKPDGGYGLIVFVSPTRHWPLTHGWKKALDRTGTIYVSARKSGNSQNVYERRIPLALHAYENVQARYRIDPARVTIGGFSGGSRTAIRIAAAYSDVFTGALLVGGAKTMGEEDFAPPPAELMALLQRRMRVVFSTGRHDAPNQRLDGRSRDALEARCVAGVFKISEANIGHEVPNLKTMMRVIERLDQPLKPASLQAQETCSKTLVARVEQDIAAVETAMKNGELGRAGDLLGAADLAWGGLAGDRLVALARELAPGFEGTPAL